MTPDDSGPIEFGDRKPLPTRRPLYSQKVKIAGHTVHLSAGEYADGQLGEVFIDMHRAGSSFRSLMNAFAIVFSLALQHGVPLSVLCEPLLDMRFEPGGKVEGSPFVAHCGSIVDLLARELCISFLGRTDLIQVPADQVSERLEEAMSGMGWE